MNKFLLIMVALLLVPALVLGANTNSSSGGSAGGGNPPTNSNSPNVAGGLLEVHGTEYYIGDKAKIFLQYLDINNEPVENSACRTNVYYPNSTQWLNHAPMFYVGHDGIYYRDFIIPNETGVFMLSAECYKPYEFLINNSITLKENFACGTWLCHNDGNNTFGFSQDQWDVEEGVNEILINDTNLCLNSDGNANCGLVRGAYGFADRGFKNPENVIAINISWKWKVVGFQNTEDASFWFWDGEWDLIHQYTKQTLIDDGYLQDVWYNESYYIDASEGHDISSIILSIEMIAGGNNDLFYYDDLVITSFIANTNISDETEYQVVRGSGELHISEGRQQLYQNIIGIGDEIVNAQISVISNDQLGQFLLIVAFLVLLFMGLVSASALIGVAYSFIYLDGLLALGGALICVMLLYFGEKQRRKK